MYNNIKQHPNAIYFDRLKYREVLVNKSVLFGEVLRFYNLRGSCSSHATLLGYCPKRVALVSSFIHQELESR